MTSSDAVRDQVRARYAAAARTVSEEDTGCCGDSAATTGCCADPGQPDVAGDVFGARLYPAAELAELPAGIREASLGCGNPIAVADLHPGETVLDLGSGAGGDVLLSARRVGPEGRVIGLDMTDEMLELARSQAAGAGVGNVEFHRGTIEDVPLPAASVDVVISNCVINLSPDKPAVFAEMFRVLRPGGRIGVTDVVADDHLTPDERAARGDWAGCVAGALSRTEYVNGLTAAGFTGVTVTDTHPVTDGMHSAIIKAVRP